MPVIHPSIEEVLFPEEDPWEWNVDQVVYALTDKQSPLRVSNPTLSLPESAPLASILREHDVNGLALLTEVKAESLRDDLGIKSMSHRASINYFVRLLQFRSPKYQQTFIISGKLSSFYGGSRFSTPYQGSPQVCGPRAPSSGPGLWQPTMTSAWYSQSGPGFEDVQASVRDHMVDNSHDRLAEPRELQRLQRPEQQFRETARDKYGSKELRMNADVNESEGSKVPELERSSNARTVTTCKSMDANTAEQSAMQPSKHARQGETIIVDNAGRKRRRLVLAQSSAHELAEPNNINSDRPQKHSNSPNTLPSDPEATELGEGNPFLNTEDTLHDKDVDSTDIQPSSVIISAVPSKSTPEDMRFELGTVLIDKQGRKRLKPILLSQLGEVHQGPQQCSKLEKLVEVTNTALPTFSQLEAVDQPRQRIHGRKATRSSDQLYIGLEAMSIDAVFYGDIGLEKNLDENLTLGTIPREDQADGFADFAFLASNNFGNGQRLYVNSRMKYFFQSQRILLKRDGREHVGIVPYPERICRKYQPLSLTVFSKSSDGIAAIRSNRFRWIKETSASRPTALGENVFNVMDPALAQDDGHDPEWGALEKWKYMDGKDNVLPLYGESGSEGEYELDTWKDMQQERGEIPRPLGRSKSRRLTSEEVREAIDEALKNIMNDWTVKREPKLQRKAWRLWMRSRRDQTTQNQIKLFTSNIEKLETRIGGLKNEIAKEEWSKASIIAKQCNILQPSVFDREDNKWKIVTLKSRNPPPKLLLKSAKAESPKASQPTEALEDDEENLESSAEASVSSDGSSLDGFVVEDDIDVEAYEAVSERDDLVMADVGDGFDSDSVLGAIEYSSNLLHQLVADEEQRSQSEGLVETYGPNCVASEHANTSFLHTHNDMKVSRSPRYKSSALSTFIDLTQQSDQIERQGPPVKSEKSFKIKTPPIFDSENDSDFFQPSQNRKVPVYRKPLAIPEAATIIDLDSDSTEFESAETSIAPRALPPFADVAAIRAMDASELVERQDRKRLLIWMIAHVPSSRRNPAFDYLRKVSMERSHEEVTSALKDLYRDKQDIRSADKEVSDCIMQIATWQVSWTIPVKVDSTGLRIPHIKTTLADEDGYEPFYDFLLQCMDHYKNRQAFQEHISPNKKRERIICDDSDDAPQGSPLRKRKYLVQESQATLDKRQAARERLLGHEKRRRWEEARRREELKHRFAGIEADQMDLLEVVVNPGKLEDQERIQLNPRFGKGARIKPHQKDGLQFLWREITTEHEDLQGCLLAHPMGLGKTMQIIALLVAISEAAQSSSENIRQQVPPTLRKPHTLVLCPPALVENWWDEFLLWAPQPSSQNVGEVRKVTSVLGLNERLHEVDTWVNMGGVLLIGYDTFKNLIHNKATKTRAPQLDDKEHSRVKQALLGRANLVIADEAHHFKTRTSIINSAMNQIETKSRIAMTGSPLNNNLDEYYTLIDWIAPNYLGTHAEFKATYEEPIREGLYQDSTRPQYRRSLTRLRALELELKPKVHRANISVLRTDLKGKSEFVIQVPLTRLQEDAYNIYVENMRMATSDDEPRTATLWTWLGILQLLCNHPKCYWQKIREGKSVPENPSGHKALPRKRKVNLATAEAVFNDIEEDTVLPDGPAFQIARSKIVDESKKVFEGISDSLNAVCLSNKMQIVMNILHLSEAAHDKVLVFSHRIATLDYIGEQLDKSHETYARIDGQQLAVRRQQITKDFNEGKINVCLISTRAGGTGLNLFGANRVVILDENFNPTWEQQAIGRAYRIGQQKFVYVYRLTVGGTFEQAIQNQALFKEQLATRVVDKKNPTRSALKGAGDYLFPPKNVQKEDLTKFLGKDPQVLDHLLADPTNNHILSITPTESFHIDDGEELTPEEKKEAEGMQRLEQLRRRDPKAHAALIEQTNQRYLRGVLEATRVPNTPSGAPQDVFPRTQPAAYHHSETSNDLLIKSSAISPTFITSTASEVSVDLRDPQALHAGPFQDIQAISGVDRSISNPATDLHKNVRRYASSSLPNENIGQSLDDSSAIETTRPKATPLCMEKQLLHRQLADPEPPPTAPENGDAENLDASSTVLMDLFRLTNEAIDSLPKERRLINQALRDAGKADFYAVMSRKSLITEFATPDTACQLYASELDRMVFEWSATEADYRRLASEVRLVLERDEVKQKQMLEVMMTKIRPSLKPQTDSRSMDARQYSHETKLHGGTTQTEGKMKINKHKDNQRTKPLGGMLSYMASADSSQTSPKSDSPSGMAKAAQRVSDLITPINGHSERHKTHKRRLNGEAGKDSNDVDEGPKHRAVGEKAHQSKKMRGAASITACFKDPTGEAEKLFGDFLHKEASRSSASK